MVAPSPKNIDELVGFIAKFVRAHTAETGRRISGAALADAVRREYPGFAYEQVGLARLADAVKVAEASGALVRHYDVSHLEVSSSEETPRSAMLLAPRTAVRIRPEVWRALVFVADGWGHFLNRKNGAVISVQSSDEARLAEVSSRSEFVCIEPIADVEQRQWMREFLATRSSLAHLEAPIDSKNWWSEFPRWLQDRFAEDPGAAWEWGAFRARKVAEHVRKWADAADVSTEFLFSPQVVTAEDRKRKSSSGDEQANCRAILAAISEMSYDELMELRLPLRYILRHFNAR